MTFLLSSCEPTSVHLPGTLSQLSRVTIGTSDTLMQWKVLLQTNQKFQHFLFLNVFVTQSQSATVSFICTISFFFCQHFKDLYLWHALTDFDQTWYQVPLPPPKHDPGVKGHVGVTGVKKVIFTKNATSPTDYRVWSCDSCTCISLTPSTKVMGLKIHPGSFGVTGVKRSFSLKTLLLLQFTGYGHVTHVHTSAWPPSTKVMGLKIHPGSFGVTGVKRLFSLKTLLLLQITG